MKKHQIAFLTAAALSLSACVTAHDREFVDSLDCKAMAVLQKSNMPTQPAAIIDNWDREQGAFRYDDDNILTQSRPAIRDSYVRRQYAKKCN